MKRFFGLLILCAAGLHGQPKYPAAVVSGVDLPTLTNNVQTYLTSAASSTDTTLQVLSTAAFNLPADGSLVVNSDNEFIHVCSKTTTTLTVCIGGRGYDNSAATAHVAYRVVKEIIVARSINQLNSEVTSIETALGPNLSNVQGLFQTWLALNGGSGGGAFVQTNSDWNASTGVAQILNKPTIPSNTSQITESGNLYFTNARVLAAMSGLYQSPINGAPGTWPSLASVATSGSYNDLANKPTLSSLGGLTNPMTTAGDFLVGGASGAPLRVAVPGNGTWCPNWSSGTVTWITCPGAGGSGITSISMTVPSGFSVAGSPLTANGTLAITLASQTAKYVLIAPSSNGVPTWRALTAGDIPALAYQATITGAPGTWPSFAAVATSGSYTDLSNKPTIPAAQVNSDWNASSGLAQILNKPTIPAAQVNSDWNAASGLAQILNKPSMYTTIYSTGLSMPQRTSINLIAGTNMTVGCVDNSGAARTDCTFSSSGGGGTGGSSGTYTGTVTFGTIPDGDCAISTYSAGGMAAGSSLTANWANAPSGTIGQAWGDTNLIYVDLCNFSGAAITPAFSLTASVGGGSGSGAGMSSQLGDLATVRSTGSVLTIGASCTSSVPCNVRFGTTSYSITTQATVTLGGSTLGTVFIYLTPSGTLTAGSSGPSLTCSSGCLVATGVTGFPTSALPIASWTTSAPGVWDTAGGADFRAFLSVAPSLANNAGITLTGSSSGYTIGTDNSIVPFKYSGIAAPGTVTGNLSGDFYNDTVNHNLYVCNAAFGTSAPACTSVTAGQWMLVNGSGGSSYTFRNNLVNTSGTVDFTPVDASVMDAMDDFLPSKNSNGAIGTLHWGVSTLGTSCGSNMVASQSNHPGIFQIVSGSTPGDGCSLTLSDNTEGALYPFINFGSAAGLSWEIQAIVQTDVSGVGNAKYLVGFSDSQSTYHPASGNDIAIRYDHSGGGCVSNESTTTWVYEVSVGGTKTCVNSGVAIASNTWYHLRIYSTAPGTIQFQINGANAGSIATAPTANMAPQFLTTSTGGSQESLFVDWWAMKIQGLTR